MTTRYTFHCDGPDCDTWGKDLNFGSWFEVKWHDPHSQTGIYHFCKSECLLAGMAGMTSPTVTIG